MRALGALALALVLTACGGDESPEQSDASPSESAPTSEGLSASPSTTAPQGPMRFGTAGDAGFGTVTVTKYQRDVPGITPEDAQILGGERVDAFYVRTCVASDSGEPVRLSVGPWSLRGKDSSSYLMLIASGFNFPSPVYPMEGQQSFAAGDCVAGWIMSAVAGDFRPDRIVYEGADLPGAPLEWRVTG